ncbi:AraC family transcriptional regulator [Nakamurella silvestris]|nr:AraC family transcriptional regulator [Nakamurella silvestris]
MTDPAPPTRDRPSRRIPVVDRRRLPTYEAGAVETPFVILGRYETLISDTSWEQHSHPTHELLWNEKGSSTATVGARTWTITPFIGLWIPAGVRHGGWAPAGTWHRAAQFNIGSVPSISAGPVAVEVTQLLRLLLDRLTGAPLSDTSRAMTEAMVIDVLTPTPRELLLHLPKAPLLAPIVEAVRSDPADGTTLNQWAARLQVSTRTITRLLRAETGLGFSQWVATARAQHAIVMLSHGEEIDDVAVGVGYGSASAFSTSFRRVTGMSPGRFRTC